jgi:hypothetical protein
LKRIVSERVIQLTWFVASVYATGAVWFYLSKEDYVSAIASVFSAIVLCAMAVYLHGLNDRSEQSRAQREQLGLFLKEAEALSAQANDIPPPIEAHNTWVARVETYLTDALDSSYAARFGNFHGMTFYGTSNPNSGLKQSFEGRSRRLHEFMAELGQK